MASIITAESSICLIHQGCSEAFFFPSYSTQTRHASKSPFICFMSHKHLCSVLFADCFLHLRVENVLCIKFQIVCKFSLAECMCPTQKTTFLYHILLQLKLAEKISGRKSVNMNYSVVLPIVPIAHSLCLLELPVPLCPAFKRNGNNWAGHWLLIF